MNCPGSKSTQKAHRWPGAAGGSENRCEKQEGLPRGDRKFWDYGDGSTTQ